MLIWEADGAILGIKVGAQREGASNALALAVRADVRAPSLEHEIPEQWRAPGACAEAARCHNTR